MSRIINAQAGVMQGLMGLPQTAAADMPADMDGGFGAVLGAVMADNSAGSDVGGVFGQEAVGAVCQAADVSAGAVNAGDASVSSGEVNASSDEVVSGEEALYDLLGAAFSDDEGDVPSMETFFAVLTGSAPEGASEVFTSRGAAAFVSAVRRFFADDDEGVSGERLMAMWQGVSANEKSAYADILSAIAGRAGVPEEETIPAGELLSAAVRIAAKAVAKLPLDRKDREKVNDNVPEYLMAAFIAPGYDVRAAAVSGDKADMAVSEVSSASSVGPVISGEQLPLDMNAGQQVSGEAAESTLAEGMTVSVDTMTSDTMSADTSVTIAADTAVTQALQASQSAVDGVSEADSEDIAEFCNILARELGVQIEREIAANRQPRPADIGRQAFMARVGRGSEADFTAVSGSISRSVNSVTSVSGEAEGVSEDTPAAEVMMSVEVEEKPAGRDNSFAGGDMPGDKVVSGRENVSPEGMTASAKADMPVRTDIPVQQAAVPFEASEDAAVGDSVNAYDAGAIADRIAYSAYRAEGDSTQLTLRLSPEELGEIRVTIVRKAGETSVAFEAQKSESAAVIGDRAAALAEALVSKGISLKEISVSDMGRDAASNGGRDSQGYSENRQPGDNEGGHRYSRHFYYSHEGDEQPEGDNFGAISSYYDKEANLWLSI